MRTAAKIIVVGVSTVALAGGIGAGIAYADPPSPTPTPTASASPTPSAQPDCAVGRSRISFRVIRRGRVTANAMTSATSSAVMASCA